MVQIMSFGGLKSKSWQRRNVHQRRGSRHAWIIPCHESLNTTNNNKNHHHNHDNDKRILVVLKISYTDFLPDTLIYEPDCLYT